MAWGDLGHEIVGAVAEIKACPATLEFIRGIIGIEPLAVAAKWPDQVRNDSRFNSQLSEFDFRLFQFAEVPTGFSYANRPNKDSKDSNGAILGATKILISQAEPREKKIIALRYLIHIVGDIHQPLHVGNGFDKGGNACSVMVLGARESSNFHSLWDTGMVNKLAEIYKGQSTRSRFAPYYPEYVRLLKANSGSAWNFKKPNLTASNLGGNLSQWIDESAQKREQIYPDNLGGTNDAYKNRPYCSWYQDQEKNILGATSVDEKSVKSQPIDQAYIEKWAKPMVEDSLIKGGARLAAILDYVAEQAVKSDPSSHLVTEQNQNDFINQVIQQMSH